MRLVIATANLDKLREFKELAAAEPWLQLEAAADNFNVEETGDTFLENAILKAKQCAQISNCLAMADDSGLAVDALRGRPGIHSARYCPGSDADRRAKLLNELKLLPPDSRKAAFVCAIALVDPKGVIQYTTEARWDGTITFAEKGNNGFGYDSIFQPLNETRTSAQLDPSEKNQVSHRAQAFKQLLQFCKTYA